MGGNKVFYMDATDFEWELGEALGPTDTYSSLEDLLKRRKCSQTCGVVKICLNADGTWTQETVVEPKPFSQWTE